MDAPTIAASASLAVALVAFAGLAARVYLRLGKLEGEVKAGRERSDKQYREAQERSDAQHAETLTEIRRLTDAVPTHLHISGGGIIFRAPPPSGSTTPE